MSTITEKEKSEMIRDLFNGMDIGNMNKREIYFTAIGIGKRFERESPTPEPYSE
jgi:hypothetical protein